MKSTACLKFAGRCSLSMKAGCLSIFAFNIATFAAAPTTAPAEARSSHHEGFSDKYASIVDHNIFLRDRGRRERSTQPSTQHASAREPAPEELVWLSGVAMEIDGFRAYAEDTSGAIVRKLAPGDSIARGKITAIEIDAVEYEHNGQRTWIAVGNDFTGNPAVVSSIAASTSPSEAPTTNASGASSQPADSSAAVQSLEERMRQRRTQELRR
jgi:hypothetical protein